MPWKAEKVSGLTAKTKAVSLGTRPSFHRSHGSYRSYFAFGGYAQITSSAFLPVLTNAYFGSVVGMK